MLKDDITIGYDEEGMVQNQVWKYVMVIRLRYKKNRPHYGNLLYLFAYCDVGSCDF